MRRESLYEEGEESHWQNDKLLAQECASRVYWERQTSHMDTHLWVCVQGVSRELEMRRKVPHTTWMAPSQRLPGPNERGMQAKYHCSLFFCSLIMDPVCRVPLHSSPPCSSPMVDHVPSNCEPRKTLPPLRQLLPGILSQKQETLPTQSWRLKPNIQSFSQFFELLSIDCDF